MLALLTSRGIEVGKVYGGRPDLTQQDVAGMMSKLAHKESELLLSKYAGYPRHRVLAYWSAHVFIHAKEQSLGIDRNKLAKLAQVTLSEFIDEPRCKACNGTKGLIIDSVWENCPKCEGVGYRRLSDRAIARAVGLHGTKLKPSWQDLVGWCRSELQVWEGEALRKIDPR